MGEEEGWRRHGMSEEGEESGHKEGETRCRRCMHALSLIDPSV